MPISAHKRPISAQLRDISGSSIRLPEAHKRSRLHAAYQDEAHAGENVAQTNACLTHGALLGPRTQEFLVVDVFKC